MTPAAGSSVEKLIIATLLTRGLGGVGAASAFSEAERAQLEPCWEAPSVQLRERKELPAAANSRRLDVKLCGADTALCEQVEVLCLRPGEQCEE